MTSYCTIVCTGYRQVNKLLYELVIDKLINYYMNWLLTSYCIIVFTGYRQLIVLLYELVIVLIIDKLLYRLLRSYYMYWLSIRYCTIICTGYLQGTVLLYVLVIGKLLTLIHRNRMYNCISCCIYWLDHSTTIATVFTCTT